MKRSLQTAFVAAALVASGHAAAQITFYEREGYRGRSITTNERLGNFERADFNNRASSIAVQHGQWEVCEHPRFEGRCAILRPGGYPSLREIGLNNAVSSARPIGGGRPAVVVAPQPVVVAPQPVIVAPQPVVVAPQPVVVEERWRRRANEVVYEAPVTSVRAVVGPPNQRCWIERQQVTEPGRNEPSLGGAVIGGIVGGILGHQVGGGTGKDLATAGGVMAGAVIGSKMGSENSGPRVVARDVQRCEAVANTKPEYWDVTYHFRGVEHHMQMTAPPGRTVLVNRHGEPRVH
jgi:uncharacterized protein YcfJ